MRNVPPLLSQTRMMAQKKSPEGIQYSGFFDALFKIPKQEGFMALYKVCSMLCNLLLRALIVESTTTLFRVLGVPPQLAPPKIMCINGWLRF